MLVCAKSKRDDSKYLVGAVPEVNGQVLFQQTFAVEGKNKQQIYDVMKAYLNQIMKGEQQMLWRMPLPVRWSDVSKNG